MLTIEIGRCKIEKRRTEKFMWKEIELDPAFVERDRKRKQGKPVEIAKTERLWIRETILEDVEVLYNFSKNLEENVFLQPIQKSLEEELEFMKAYISHAYTFYDYGLWTVLEKTSRKVVGRVGLTPSTILEDVVELAYLIGKDFQKQGYAKEAGRAVISYAFEVLDLEELHILIDENNLASIKTAESFGSLELLEDIKIENKQKLKHYRIKNTDNSCERINKVLEI